MNRARELFCMITFAATNVFALSMARTQQSSLVLPSQPTQKADNPSLKVSLRLQDETPFSGRADVRVMPNEGYEIPGEPADTPGEFEFHDVVPGKYSVEVRALGYLNVRLSVDLAVGDQQKT